MRTLGVYGANLPTKSERSVEPADFSKAALIGNFARKFDKAFPFRNTQEALQVLGPQDNPASYGWDAVNGFFANLRGNPGTLYVLPYKGTSAVQANVSLNDAQSPTPEATLKLSAAFQGEDEYGVSGNRTGYTFLRGASFSSAVTTLPTGSGATARVMTLESVVGFKVGDVLHLYKTGYAEYHFLTEVDEAAKTVTWADTDYAGTGTAADYTAACLAFKINIYRKDTKGVVSEVDTDIGKQWCTFNSADPDKYVENVLQSSSWMKATKLAVSGGPTAAELFPADVATVAYLASGADGSAPASVADWNAIYALLDNLPVRQIANVETSNADYQKALETYAANRTTNDNPIVAYVGEFDLSTKAEAVAAGQAFQRSDEVDAVFVHNWIGVPDPFAVSPSSPKRAVPNAGHIMGWWIAGIATYGIHAIPARKSFPLRGASEVYGYTSDADTDRTDLAEAGVNVIQNIAGRGLIVRNLFTSSTDKAFRFANALMMRNFIKISGVDSLQDSENTPNDISGVREDRMAMLQFMNRLWTRGSTGNVKEGETFGRYEKDDGTLSEKADAFEVIADASNNSVATLQAGERNIDTWFQAPSPAGSIRVGVGLIYKVQ